MSKTIADLEAAADAASKEYSAAETRLDSLIRVIKAVTVLKNIDMLTAEDEADVARLRDRAHERRLLLVAECERLEDASLAAQRALNDAPEQGRVTGAEKSAALLALAAEAAEAGLGLIAAALTQIARLDFDNRGVCDKWAKLLLCEVFETQNNAIARRRVFRKAADVIRWEGA